MSCSNVAYGSAASPAITPAVTDAATERTNTTIAPMHATFEQDMAAPLSTVDVQLGSIVLLQLTVGTVIGVWALVQGIFAVVLKRGRAYGVAAIAVAVCAPVVSMIVYTVTSSVIIATRM